ncbi:MAG: hypothetical protein ACYDAK_12815 [Candidatus Limnocylindrales bacterium]
MRNALIRVLTYIAARLREPSTYPGLMLIASGITHWSVADDPSRQQTLMDIGIALAGLISAVLPDRIGTNTRINDPKAGDNPNGPSEEK